MHVELTRPGTLPQVLIEGHGWNVDALRHVSYENEESWKALLVRDDAGPVGAVCFRIPEIHPWLIVDTVILHPERTGSITQMEALVAAVLPRLRQYAERFHATRIVWESVSGDLNAVLRNRYDAREDSVVLSIGMDETIRFDAQPNIYVMPPTAAPVVFDSENFGVFRIGGSSDFASPCGRENKSRAGKAAHERHCAKCKGAL